MRSILGQAAALVLVSTALWTVPAMAGETPEVGVIGLGVTGGTLGVGPEVSVAVTRTIAVRGNVTFLDINHGFSSGSIHYDGSARLGSGGVMLDYHPGGGGFFVSGGARINKNKVRATATPTSGATINGTSYTAAQIGTISGYADFTDLAPVLTLGYAGSLRKGVKLGIEAGAMFSGGARVYPLSYTGTVNAISATDLEAERARLQDDISKFKVHPVVQLSLGYRF